MSNIKRGRRMPFVIVPYWLLDHPDVDTYDIAVYCAIARHADAAGEAHPSRSRIAKLAKVNIKTVDRSVEQLQAVGALEKQTRRDPAGDPTSNLYLIHELSTEVETLTVLPSDSDGTTVGTDTVLRVATVAVQELEPLEQDPMNLETDGDDLWKTDPRAYAKQQLQQSLQA